MKSTRIALLSSTLIVAFAGAGAATGGAASADLARYDLAEAQDSLFFLPPEHRAR